MIYNIKTKWVDRKGKGCAKEFHRELKWQTYVKTHSTFSVTEVEMKMILGVPFGMHYTDQTTASVRMHKPFLYHCILFTYFVCVSEWAHTCHNAHVGIRGQLVSGFVFPYVGDKVWAQVIWFDNRNPMSLGPPPSQRQKLFKIVLRLLIGISIWKII